MKKYCIIVMLVLLFPISLIHSAEKKDIVLIYGCEKNKPPYKPIRFTAQRIRFTTPHVETALQNIIKDNISFASTCFPLCITYPTTNCDVCVLHGVEYGIFYESDLLEEIYYYEYKKVIFIILGKIPYWLFEPLPEYKHFRTRRIPYPIVGGGIIFDIVTDISGRIDVRIELEE